MWTAHPHKQTLMSRALTSWAGRVSKMVSEGHTRQFRTARRVAEFEKSHHPLNNVVQHEVSALVHLVLRHVVALDNAGRHTDCYAVSWDIGIHHGASAHLAACANTHWSKHRDTSTQQDPITCTPRIQVWNKSCLNLSRNMIPAESRVISKSCPVMAI